MYLIRRAKLDDVSTLLKLARMVYFINLPPDKDIIAEKIRRSTSSFLAAAEHPDDGGNESPSGAGSAHASKRRRPEAAVREKSASANSPIFMFCIEDVQTGNCLGTSSIISKMGGPGHPNLSLQMRSREFFSRDLQQGVKHITAQLHLDETSPTEIGGLILQPSMRGHPQKIGKQLSIARFHFVGLYRRWFSDRVIAEMMGPITPDGNNTLWEYFGRRFINLSYAEADKFCQYSREFMTSLLPREEIYLTLLPPEARALIGQVGADTQPARRMLEEIGFKAHDKVDPFDGGPQLECPTDDITLVSATRRLEFAGICTADEATSSGFVSTMHADGDFRMLHTPFAADGGTIRVPRDQAAVLGAQAGMTVGATPLDLGPKRGAHAERGRARHDAPAGA